MIAYSDFFVQAIALPYHIKGLVVSNGDGTYSVYINAHLSWDVQRKTLEHELIHIARNHLFDEEPVSKNEEDAG